MEPIIIKIPGAVPSVNNLYITGKACGGRKLLSKQQREFRERVRDAVHGLSVGGSLVSVEIGYRPADRRRRDVDNYIKAIFDGLTAAGFWEDDSQVRRVTCYFLKPAGRDKAATFLAINEVTWAYGGQ